MLRSKIGKRVNYKPPRDVAGRAGPGKTGTVVDEVWVDEERNASPPHDHNVPHCWGDYAFFAQLVEWDHDPEKSVRLGYYRRRCGEKTGGTPVK